MEKTNKNKLHGILRQRNKFCSSKGFTMTELIIALFILTIVGAMTTVIFRSTQQSFTNARAFQHVIDLARQSVERMQSEMKAAFVATSGLVNMVGIDSTGTKLKADSVADEFFFIVPDKGSPTGDICEVGYWQRSDGNIIRHYEMPPDFNFTTVGSDDELGLVVTDLNFEYSDGLNFFNSWDSRPGGAQEGTFPEAIHFSFFVSDKTNIIKKKFESHVRIASSGR